MPETKVNTAKHVAQYYRGVRGYHQFVEDQPIDTFVVPPGLLLRFMEPNGLTVDIAGGSGINAKLLRLPAWKYVCVDISAEGLRLASERRRGMCVQVEVVELPLRDGSADTVLCSWSLEHMTDPETVLVEMIRIMKTGGRMLIWGPNWDNIFRKDFPQFAHKKKSYIRRVRWQIFWKMIRNEFLPFRYHPLVDLDVAALADPSRYISGDTDAVHCVLCQETVKLLKQRGMRIVHVSDFSDMGKHLYNDSMISLIRRVLAPLLPVLRRIPLIRWFVIRFPVVVEKPTESGTLNGSLRS